MSQQDILAFLVGAAIAMPLSAFIGKLAILWVGRFRVQYLRVLTSTAITYAAVFALGWLASVSDMLSSNWNGVRLVVGWGILAGCHVSISRSPAGERLSSWKAVLVALLQVVGAIVFLFSLLLIASSVTQILA